MNSTFLSWKIKKGIKNEVSRSQLQEVLFCRIYLKFKKMCSDKERIRPIKSKNFRAGELYLSGDLTKFYKGTNSTKGGQNIQIKGKRNNKNFTLKAIS